MDKEYFGNVLDVDLYRKVHEVKQNNRGEEYEVYQIFTYDDGKVEEICQYSSVDSFDTFSDINELGPLDEKLDDPLHEMFRITMLQEIMAWKKAKQSK